MLENQTCLAMTDRYNSDYTDTSECTVSPSYAEDSLDYYEIESCDDDHKWVTSYNSRKVALDMEAMKSAKGNVGRRGEGIADCDTCGDDDESFCSRRRTLDIEDVATESIKAVSLSAALVTDTLSCLTSSCVVDPINICSPIEERTGTGWSPSRTRRGTNQSLQSTDRGSTEDGSVNNSYISGDSGENGRYSEGMVQRLATGTSCLRATFKILRCGGKANGSKERYGKASKKKEKYGNNKHSTQYAEDALYVKKSEEICPTENVHTIRVVRAN